MVKRRVYVCLKRHICRYPRLLLDYELLSRINDIVEESFMQLRRVDGCLATLLTYLEPIERHSGCRLNVYKDTFRSHAREGVNKPIRRVLRFLQIWVPEERELPAELQEWLGMKTEYGNFSIC